jgi:hypothetical protein
MSIAIKDPLAEYADFSEHTEHARVARLIADYHDAKSTAMEFRLDGSMPDLIKQWDAEADRLAKEIEEAT